MPKTQSIFSSQYAFYWLAGLIIGLLIYLVLLFFGLPSAHELGARYGRAMVYVAFVILSVAMSVVLFGFLGSSGVVKAKGYQFGGAAAFCLVLASFLIWKFDTSPVGETTIEISGVVYLNNYLQKDCSVLVVGSGVQSVVTNPQGEFSIKLSQHKPKYKLLAACGKYQEEFPVSADKLTDLELRLVDGNVSIEKLNTEVLINYAEKTSSMDAQAELANRFLEGDRIKKDYSEAEKWARLSAGKGCARAETLLGRILEKGLVGEDPRPKEAIKFYEKAANKGDDNAALRLFLIYSKSEGNEVERKKWCDVVCPRLDKIMLSLKGLFELSAEDIRTLAKAGDAEAQYRLGLLYWGGALGLPKNRFLAQEWFQKAEKQGHLGAKAYLENLSDETKQPVTDSSTTEVKPPITEVVTQPATDNKKLHKNCKLPEMVTIPGGKFMMGSNDGHADEKPVHEVTVNDFAIGKYEVTFEEYDCFAEQTNREKPKDNGWGRGKQPVIDVSWNDAIAYTKWLSQQTGEQYRLPTEAEWEYAARARTQSKWHFGDDESQLGNYAWYWDNSGKQTHPVGRKQPNQFGLYDMAGNVWEWTCSDYTNSYDGNETKCSNSSKNKSLRGGSWLTYAGNCRAASRSVNSPSLRDDVVGFRLILFSR